LGPGLLESVYEAALLYELKLSGLFAASQIVLPVFYKNIQLDLGFRIDVLVEDTVIIEIKSVECLHDVHKKISLNYLRLAE
jgi:GxxExxY protein